MGAFGEGAAAADSVDFEGDLTIAGIR